MPQSVRRRVAGAARADQKDGVGGPLQGDVEAAARSLVTGDADGADAGLLVVAVRGELAVQGEQALQEDVLVRETDEALVGRVAGRHLHVLAAELVGGGRVRRGAVALVALMAPELGAGLEEEVFAHPQQPEARALRGDRTGAAVRLQTHVELVRASVRHHGSGEPDRLRGRGRGAGLRLDRGGGQLAHPVRPRVRILTAAPRQSRPRHDQGAHRAHQCGPAGTALENRSHRWAAFRTGVHAGVRAGAPCGGPHGVPTTAYGSVPVPPRTGGASPSGPLTRAYPTGTG